MVVGKSARLNRLNESALAQVFKLEDGDQLDFLSLELIGFVESDNPVEIKPESRQEIATYLIELVKRAKGLLSLDELNHLRAMLGEIEFPDGGGWILPLDTSRSDEQRTAAKKQVSDRIIYLLKLDPARFDKLGGLNHLAEYIVNTCGWRRLDFYTVLHSMNDVINFSLASQTISLK
jgi:hypothetical protein